MVAEIDVDDATVKRAAVPLNVTALAPLKPTPVIVTAVPTGPLVGATPVTVAVTVKLETLVAAPHGLATWIFPVVAPSGTVAEIEVAEATLNVAATPLNLTLVAPLKPLPAMVTVFPVAALVGVKLEIDGGMDGVTVNDEALVPVPEAVVTATRPVVAPLGTVARSCVAETTVKAVAATPLKRTALAPEKYVPLIVTDVPTGPLVGENDVTVGATEAVTVNAAEVDVDPTGVLTRTGPLVAPAGTVARISLAETSVKVADFPLNATCVAAEK